MEDPPASADRLREVRAQAAPAGASGMTAASRRGMPAKWRFFITLRWLGWHVFVILSVLCMLWLGNWQLHRAESGNSLSWAYTFEWPLFAIFAVYFWVKTIRDEVQPPPQAKPEAEPAENGEELVPDNAYLARLTEEVRGHGRWHGLR